MSSTFQSHNSSNSTSNRYPSFSYDIREFINQCRREQTLFVNLEGQFEKRCFKRCEEDSLINYVSETMRIKEYSGYMLDEFDQKPSMLAQKILGFTSRGDEVYCSNFWLYYYKYEDKSKHSIPVFKIFHGKEADDFFIFDTNLVSYNNFEDFLSGIDLPLSFICVPRNGKYVFVDDKLSLEFICSNKNSNAGMDFPAYTPFSQRIYRFIVNVDWCGMGADFLSIVGNFLEYFPLTTGSIVTYLKRLNIYFTNDRNSNESEFYNDGLMLCNFKKEAIGKESPQTGCMKAAKDLCDLYPLLENPKGKWREIIRRICELVLKIPNPMAFKMFHPLESLNSCVTKIILVISVVKVLAVVGIKVIDLTEEALTDSGTLPEVKFSGNDVQSKENDPCARTINYEAALENLYELSNMSASKFEERFTEKPTPATETHIESFSPKLGFNFLGVEDGAAFFIITRASPAQINYYADIFNASIKPDGPTRSKIIKETSKGKKEIGALIYVSDFVVVGFINEEELPEGANVRDRIKRKNKGLSGLDF